MKNVWKVGIRLRKMLGKCDKTVKRKIRDIIIQTVIQNDKEEMKHFNVK